MDQLPQEVRATIAEEGKVLQLHVVNACDMLYRKYPELSHSVGYAAEKALMEEFQSTLAKMIPD